MLLAIARELLTNAARHAKAEEVTVTLRKRDDALELEIADDGRGFSAGRREEALSEGHIGLASVHERVRSFNGSFSVESSSSGTRAVARIPLADLLAGPSGLRLLARG